LSSPYRFSPIEVLRRLGLNDARALAFGNAPIQTTIQVGDLSRSVASEATEARAFVGFEIAPGGPGNISSLDLLARAPGGVITEALIIAQPPYPPTLVGNPTAVWGVVAGNSPSRVALPLGISPLLPNQIGGVRARSEVVVGYTGVQLPVAQEYHPLIDGLRIFVPSGDALVLQSLPTQIILRGLLAWRELADASPV